MTPKAKTKTRLSWIGVFGILVLIGIVVFLIAGLDQTAGLLEFYGLRVLLVFLCLWAWFLTQRLIHYRGFPEAEIGDLGHQLLKKFHSKLFSNKEASRKLLILSSFTIDLFGLFLIFLGILGPSLSPFLALIVLFIFRQISQVFCALPAPREMIWYHPGFPSLFVTYTTTNDFFFSGHTAIAVLGAIVAISIAPWYFAVLALLAAVFEIITVLALKAHYTMDVIGAVLGAGCAYVIAVYICNLLGI